MEEILVGMADLKSDKKPNKITTLGLGSCIGIALYDGTTGIGGLAHIMLPSSSNIAPINNKKINNAKFADTAIEQLVDDLISLGANQNRIVAKIAGGAHMFEFKSSNNILKIGDKNYEAVLEKLKEKKIKIISEDCGKNYGRTVTLDLSNGDFIIKAVGKEIKII